MARTPNFKFPLPAFNERPWQDLYYEFARTADAVLARYINIYNMQGLWDNSTAYTVGQRVVDDTQSAVYECAVAHTSAAATTTFAQDRAAHPTYWTLVAADLNQRGSWVTATSYVVGDFVMSGSKYAVCQIAHTSGATFAADLVLSYWTVLVDLSSQEAPTFVANSSNLIATMTKTSVRSWPWSYESIATMGSVPMLSLTNDNSSELKLYFADVSGGMRVFLWDDAVTLNNVPHTGIKPTFAVHGDVLLGDIVALDVNPMTYFMRDQIGLAASAVTQLFSSRFVGVEGDTGTQCGAVIVLAPQTGGSDNDGYISLSAYGSGSGSVANSIRFFRRTALGVSTETARLNKDGHWEPLANNTYDFGTTSAYLRNIYATKLNKITFTAPATAASVTLADNVDLTFAGDFTTVGAYAVTMTFTGATGVTFPTTGTLATLAGTESLSNKTLASPTITLKKRFSHTAGVNYNFEEEWFINPDNTISTYTTVLTISPNTVTNVYGYVVVEFECFGDTGAVGNGYRFSRWGASISNAAPVCAVVGADVTDGSGSPKVKLVTSGNNILVQVASSNESNTCGGGITVKIKIGKTSTAAATWTIT